MQKKAVTPSSDIWLPNREAVQPPPFIANIALIGIHSDAGSALQSLCVSHAPLGSDVCNAPAVD